MENTNDTPKANLGQDNLSNPQENETLSFWQK